jgi:hypothetical protein
VYRVAKWPYNANTAHCQHCTQHTRHDTAGAAIYDAGRPSLETRCADRVAGAVSLHGAPKTQRRIACGSDRARHHFRGFYSRLGSARAYGLLLATRLRAHACRCMATQMQELSSPYRATAKLAFYSPFGSARLTRSFVCNTMMSTICRREVNKDEHRRISCDQ